MNDNVNTSDDIKFLARGPQTRARRFNAFNVNGFKFRTLAREEGLKTQNSGVWVTSETRCYASVKDGNVALANLLYYGKLVDIIELNYYGHMRVVLFKCLWANTRGVRKDDFQFNLVNFSRLIHTGDLIDDEPYILASHAQMVYYVDDKTNPPWNVAIHVKPRDLYEMGDEEEHDEEVGRNQNQQIHLEQQIISIFPNDIDNLQLLRGDEGTNVDVEIENSDQGDDMVCLILNLFILYMKYIFSF